MADTNLTGAIVGTRQGSACVRHSFRVTGNTSTAAVRFMRIAASTVKPTTVEVQVLVTTVDGGGSPTLSVGSVGTGYTDIINGASLATAATGGTFLPASNALGKYVFTADTDLYYKLGGTPDGVGVSTILLNVATINTSTITGI